MQVKYAIFDMDGTLLDSMHVWDNLGEDILSRHGISAQKDTLFPYAWGTGEYGSYYGGNKHDPL